MTLEEALKTLDDEDSFPMSDCIGMEVFEAIDQICEEVRRLAKELAACEKVYETHTNQLRDVIQTWKARWADEEWRARQAEAKLADLRRRP
jgi:hypothetical protein